VEYNIKVSGNNFESECEKIQYDNTRHLGNRTTAADHREKKKKAKHNRQPNQTPTHPQKQL
jgi:hypothetical protein